MPLGDQEFRVPLEIDYGRNQLFTGRIEILEEITKLLAPDTSFDSSGGAKIVVLQGMAGLGKTQIARQYVYTRQRFHSTAFWINMHSYESMIASFVTIAERIIRHYATMTVQSEHFISVTMEAIHRAKMVGIIDGDGKAIPDETSSVPEAVKSWLSKERNDSWLLVFDNYDDLDNENFQIDKYIPTSALGGSVLITSRRRESNRLGVLKEIPLMDMSEGVDLLLKCYGKWGQPLRQKGRPLPCL